MEFSFRRMLLLLKRKCIMNAWNLIAPVLGTAIFAVMGRIFGWGENTVVTVACFAILISFAQLPFFEYKTKNSRANQILLPSSNLEKYISEFVFFFVIYSVVVTIALYLGIALSGLVWGTFDWWIFKSYNQDLHNVLVKEFAWVFYLWAFFVLSALFFNSLLFKKRSVLISFVVDCGLNIVIFITTMVMFKQYLFNDADFFPDYAMEDYFVVVVNTFYSWGIGFMVLCSLFFTVFGYFRLREERA